MNIYISGLSYGINNADLTNLFAEFGEVSSAKVILDRETGRSRGFAFVEMTNDAEGQQQGYFCKRCASSRGKTLEW